ncbi:hypothetical protein CHS0354_008063 [Potamilus streckersoni]|uniref:Uncharacterized protein n=1 Tax=Potamilus streckersoni TaxID=2493646 RepID=A0AAE0VS54_9BIVA|nr:hypothetical protein CHS0354_008063 [Potamilus streckersoni]
MILKCKMDASYVTEQMCLKLILGKKKKNRLLNIHNEICINACRNQNFRRFTHTNMPYHNIFTQTTSTLPYKHVIVTLFIFTSSKQYDVERGQFKFKNISQNNIYSTIQQSAFAVIQLNGGSTSDLKRGAYFFA